jgi:hypothetical protein
MSIGATTPTSCADPVEDDDPGRFLADSIAAVTEGDAHRAILFTDGVYLRADFAIAAFVNVAIPEYWPKPESSRQ